MKILGHIRRDEVVLDGNDVASALALVDTVPATTDTDYNFVQVATTNEHHVAGDIFRVVDGNWEKIEPSTISVGAIKDIVCPMQSNTVSLRWTDPEDSDLASWSHTRILRKYNSYPQDPTDGVLVIDSHVKNNYKLTPMYDFLPPGTENNWYYRVFVFSSNGSVYSKVEECVFQPIELSWEKLPQIVKDGNGPRVFAPGDAVEIMLKNGNNTMFTVGGFDTVELEDNTLEHCIVFVSTDCIYDKLPWDEKWDKYVLTTDIYVTSKSKVYYIKEGTNFVPVTNLRLGSRIPENTYYEMISNENRINHGGNMWASSAIRTFLGSTTTATTGLFRGITPPSELMPDNIMAMIATAKVMTTLPVVDGIGAEHSLDKFFLPSTKEVFNFNPTRVWFTLTSDTSPKEIYTPTTDTERDMTKTYFVDVAGVIKLAEDESFDVDGSFFDGIVYFELVPKTYYLEDGENSYRPAGPEDFTPDYLFVEGVEYYDRNETNIDENGYLENFSNELLNERVKRDSSNKACAWWLRSADITTDNMIYCVTEGGEPVTKPVYNVAAGTRTEAGVAIAFVIA